MQTSSLVMLKEVHLDAYLKKLGIYSISFMYL